MKPRTYQPAFIRDILGAFRAGHRRVLACLPTGAGKTWCAREIANLSTTKSRRVMFITDRRDLTHQADDAMGGGIIMGDVVRDPDALIVSTTWQTLAERPALRARIDAEPHLIIVDEADRWARGMIALLSDFPPLCKALLLTATPGRSDKGEGMSQIADVLVEGPTPVALLQQGWLTPFTIHDIGRGDGKLDVPEAIACAYDGWLPYKDRPTLGICTTQEHARNMAAYWQGRGHWAEVVIQDTKDRAALYSRVRTHGGTLFGVDVPGRGIDIPPLSCLLVCRRLSSWMGIVQEQGRLTRLCRPCARCRQHIQWGRMDCWDCGHVHPEPAPGWKPAGVILDQAGNWTRGRLDLIAGYEMDAPADVQPGLQPARVCPGCGALMSLTARVCPECDCDMPPPEVKPAAVGEWTEVGEVDRAWQWCVEEARVMGRQPAWVWHKMGSPGGRDAPDLQHLKTAIARLTPSARRAWVARVHERVPRVWMAARVGFR